MNDFRDHSFVLGIDFGTDSVRALLVDALTGKEMSFATCEFERWKKGMYCDPSKNQFRQNPQDYIDAMTDVIRLVLGSVDSSVKALIKGISLDSTGSSPGFVNKQLVPLCQTDIFRDDPNAMFVLWKDHSAVKEAEEINQATIKNFKEDYLKYVGAVYSAEWFWAKLIYLLRQNENFSREEYSFIEHCDWMTAILTGCEDLTKVKHSRCAAGHKALWNKEFGGLPPLSFFEKIEPRIIPIYKNLYTQTFTCDVVAGNLSKFWAQKLGLSTDVVVGIGALDAHMGAVGAGIKPYDFVRVMGTSTCDIVTAPYENDVLIKGICGQVEGSVVPHKIGFEAGQSSFGDVFAWLKTVLTWSCGSVDKKDEDTFLQRISKEAEKIVPTKDSPVALDWLNGRRTPLANQRVTSGIIGLRLGTDAPAMYKAYAESVAFGARAIWECFENQGLTLGKVIAIGGVAKKSALIMQVLADVLQKEVHVVKSEQCCALGAAIFAAVVSGVYDTTEQAMLQMASSVDSIFKPNTQYKQVYNFLYKKYLQLGVAVETLGNLV